MIDRQWSPTDNWLLSNAMVTHGKRMRTSISKQEIIEAFRPFHPERIILFGSQAREDQDEASDVDAS